MKNKAGHPRTRPPPPSEDEKKRRRRASTERWHKKKFGRDRYPKRGRQPLDPKERKRRRGIATRKAAKKWRSKNRNKIAQYNQDHYARTHPKIPRHEIESLSDTLSAIRGMEITAPEYRRISAEGLSVYEPWEDPEQMEARMKLSGEIPCTLKELKQLQRNAAKKKDPMPNEKPQNHPPKPTPEDDAAAAELAKLTKEFTAALRRLMPAAERASKRGKHSLLRLISRKLPRLKPPTDDTTNDDDEHTEIIFDFDKPITRERCLANAAAELEKGHQELADYWTTNAPKFKPEAEGGGPTHQEEARLAADDEAFHQRNSLDTMRKPAKTLAKTLVSEDDRHEVRTTRSGPPTSGAPRSANEEPWPGQANFPRPKRGLMRRR